MIERQRDTPQARSHTPIKYANSHIRLGHPYRREEWERALQQNIHHHHHIFYRKIKKKLILSGSYLNIYDIKS
jgi:hypothetical protein